MPPVRGPRQRPPQAIASGPPPHPGGGGVWGPGPGRPSHTRKIFLRQKNEIYQRGRKFEADFTYTNFFFASDLPPTRRGGGVSLSNSPSPHSPTNHKISGGSSGAPHAIVSASRARRTRAQSPASTSAGACARRRYCGTAVSDPLGRVREGAGGTCLPLPPDRAPRQRTCARQPAKSPEKAPLDRLNARPAPPPAAPHDAAPPTARHDRRSARPRSPAMSACDTA